MQKDQPKTVLEAALSYRERGYSVIPVKKNKKPFISWEEFQKRLSTSEEIKGWWRKWPSANVGIVTGKVSGICVIDIDEPEGFEAIQEYIPDSLEIPAARTPKGGQHLYFRAPDPCPGNNAKLIPGCDFRGEGGYIIAPPSTNAGGKPYEWLEGLSIFWVEPPELHREYLEHLNTNAFKYLSTNTCSYRDLLDKSLDKNQKVLTFQQGTRDEDLFHVANCLVKGQASLGMSSQVLHILAANCDPPFPPQEADAKVKSALARARRKERNISQEIREFVLSSSGLILSSEVQKCLGLSSTEGRKIVWWTLNEMVKEGLVEKVADRHGGYRSVDREVERMEFLTASTETVDIKLPFGIDEKVEIMPGNVIVLAGEINSGKTAFCLNVIHDNMDDFEIHYFNSEMGGGELKKRLQKFDIPLESWKFKAWERSDNFGDVIASGKGKLNIVDYLELTDNFYQVGGLVSEIHKKLKGAVALIVLQKNPGTDVGLGGFRSLEKPRLALAMGKGTIKIVKAKNWRTGENPNGLVTEFKLYNGCKLHQMGYWHYET